MTYGLFCDALPRYFAMLTPIILLSVKFIFQGAVAFSF